MRKDQNLLRKIRLRSPVRKPEVSQVESLEYLLTTEKIVDLTPDGNTGAFERPREPDPRLVPPVVEEEHVVPEELISLVHEMKSPAASEQKEPEVDSRERIAPPETKILSPTSSAATASAATPATPSTSAPLAASATPAQDGKPRPKRDPMAEMFDMLQNTKQKRDAKQSHAAASTTLIERDDRSIRTQSSNLGKTLMIGAGITVVGFALGQIFSAVHSSERYRSGESISRTGFDSRSYGRSDRSLDR